MGEELLQRALVLKEQSEEVERQLDFVTQQIKELNEFQKGLAYFEDSDEKEMFASLGRGVHMQVDRKKDEKLYVEVGAGVIVRKTPKETRGVIGEQIKKFSQARVQLTAQLQVFHEEFAKMLQEVEKLKNKNKV